MKLYGGELSPYVRKVKTALYEKGLGFEFLDADEPGHIAEMRRLTPRGEMPVLVADDVVITDSTIALEYLEEQYPTPPLLPADPGLRVKARALEDLSDRLGDALIFALARVFMWGESELTDALVPAAQRELRDLYAYLETQLGEGDYFCGDHSFADCALIVHVMTAKVFQSGPADFPRLEAWRKRCRARPAVAKNLAEVRAAAEKGMRLTRPPGETGPVAHNFRGERAEFFLRNGLADYVRDGLARGVIRVGRPLMDA